MARSGGIVKYAVNIQLEHMFRKFVGIFPPWILFLFVMPFFGTVAYELWSHNVIIVVLFYLTAGVILTSLVWKLSHGRRKLGKYHNTITMASVVLWLLLATLTGPFNHPAVDIWLSCGTVLCITWNLRTAIRGDGEEHDSISWTSVSEDANIGPSRWKTLPASNAKKLQGLVTVAPGQDAMALMNSKRANLASRLKVPLSGVRVIPVIERADQAIVTVVKEDYLRNPLEWMPSEYGGKSIADGPIRIGVYEDGEEVFIELYSNTGARHLLISGMNGSGKSVGARVILADLFGRKDVNIIAIDAVKGVQTLGCAIEGIDWFLSNKKDAQDVMEQLIHVINKRADYLGRNGYDAWEPGCGINFLVVLIEEAPSVIRDADSFTRIVEQARSAGVSVIASIQRASYTNMPTDARSQFGTVLCFGVQKEIDATFVLSDDVVDRGATPHLWQQKKPGYAYLQSPTVEHDRDVVPLRVFNIMQSQVAEVASHRTIAGLDTVTGAAAGELYTKYLEAKAKEPTDNTVELLRVEADEELEGVTIDTEIDEPEEHELVFERPDSNVRLSPQEAKEAFDDFIKDKQEFSAKDLYPLLEITGRKRTWIHSQLKERLAAGTLEHLEESGRWRAINANSNSE